MLRVLKAALVLTIAGLMDAKPAFAWVGTDTLLTTQTAALDFGATRYYYPFPAGGELGGPQVPWSCARLNVGVITYAFDETFLAYFGTKGEAAVDAAMGTLNALPTFVSGANPGLTAYLTQGNQRINYTAQALQLYDLKSATLGLMMERMGLLGETHVYDLSSRSALPSPPYAAGEYQYTMVMRNYDPDTLLPTSYVNGSSYGFQIFDNGTTADAIEEYNDTTVLPFASTAVATREALNVGGFYLGLSRDDVGGLRYLYNPTRFENETLDTTCFPGTSSSSQWAPAVVVTNGTTTVAGQTTTVTTTTGGFTGLLGGVGHIHFAKVAYNSAIGTTFGTNVCQFTIPMMTNGLVSMMTVLRTNTAPDIIFAAADLTTYAYPLVTPLYTRNMTFTAPPADPAGVTTPPPPSTILETAVVITFNDAGPLYYNLNPTTLAQDGFVETWNWATFDSGTNVTVYPQPAAIAALEQAAAEGTGVTLDTFDPAGTNAPVTSPIIEQQ
jgi:hypothetical protein